MQYENGKPYIFRYGGCTLRVTLENFGPQAVENFNRALAYEKVKEYQKNNERLMIGE